MIGNTIEHSKIRLTDGTVIEKDADGKFPPLMNILPNIRACVVCPVRHVCQDNNEFDCNTYGMFDGFYATLNDLLDKYAVEAT